MIVRRLSRRQACAKTNPRNKLVNQSLKPTFIGAAALAAMAKPGVAAAPTKEFDATWGGGFLNPERFLRVMHAAMTK